MLEMDSQTPICSPVQWYYSISTLKNTIHKMKISPSALLQDPNPEAVVSDVLLTVHGTTHTTICRELQCQQSTRGWLQEAESPPPTKS